MSGEVYLGGCVFLVVLGREWSERVRMILCVFEGLGLFSVCLMVTLIWLFWKGESESESERNENGLGQSFAFSSVR